jgi:polyribonucleotide nucleotidyltransferase
MPGCDGLLHVSEMANYRVNDVRDEVREGEQIEVKVANIDPSGKVRLSRKPLLKEGEGDKPRYSPEEKAAHKAAAPPEREGGFGGRGGDRGGRPGGGRGGGGGRGPRR